MRCLTCVSGPEAASAALKASRGESGCTNPLFCYYYRRDYELTRSLRATVGENLSRAFKVRGRAEKRFAHETRRVRADKTNFCSRGVCSGARLTCMKRVWKRRRHGGAGAGAAGLAAERLTGNLCSFKVQIMAQIDWNFTVTPCTRPVVLAGY